MKCRTFDKRLYDYLDGTLAGPDRAEFERHRASCARCAARMESESQAARLVRAAVQDECRELEFGVSGDTRALTPGPGKPSILSPIAGWRIPAAIAALLVIALLIPAIVRKSGLEAGDSWGQEIDVTYENGLVAETTLISHDSGADTIIEIQVSYYP